MDTKTAMTNPSMASEAIKAFEAMSARLDSTDGYYAWNEEAEDQIEQ